MATMNYFLILHIDILLHRKKSKLDTSYKYADTLKNPVHVKFFRFCIYSVLIVLKTIVHNVYICNRVRLMK